jgi:hypothetical protein
MDTAITTFKAIAIISVIFSVLFVALRTYACYWRKPKGCSKGCECGVDRIIDYDIIYGEDKKEEPKRKQVKKRVSAIKDGKLVFEKVSELPAKKKPGRKKKEL